MLHQATCELECRVKKVRLKEGGITIWGMTVHAGQEFVAMRRYQTTDGNWSLALGNNGRVQIACVDEEKVEYITLAK